MCLIDHKNKIIFVAIPKCASTSIRTYLQKILKKDNNQIMCYKKQCKSSDILQKHSKANEISSLIENYSDYTSIAIIRNPFDWYVSWYTYRKRKGSGFPTNKLTFKEYLEKQPMDEILSFVCDENDNIIVDHIIRLEEDLDEQIKNILSNIISYPIYEKINKTNVSEKREYIDYRKYYDDETIKIVEKLQAKTLDKFGYKY